MKHAPKLSKVIRWRPRKDIDAKLRRESEKTGKTMTRIIEDALIAKLATKG